jgi:hypothetical protein
MQASTRKTTEAFRWSATVVMGVLLAPCVLAHQGPPFPLIMDQRVGPYMLSIWTHPDIGTGTFWVNVDPLPGQTLPDGNTVRVGIQPVSGRLPEVWYNGERQYNRDHQQFYVETPFDIQDQFRVRVVVDGPAGKGEVHGQVEATPAGFGRWDLLFYAFPFLFLAGFFLYGTIRRRRARALGTPNRPRPAKAVCSSSCCKELL